MGSAGHSDERPHDAEGQRDVRRVGALVRDEGRLRRALARHDRSRFDVTTALVVQERVEDLLQTVEAIAADDDFWDRLRETARRPLTRDQLERLQALDGLALAALLQAAGYRTPPPPPVDELVDETLASLADTLDDSAGIRSAGEAVSAAQRDLITLVLRVRRQIAPSRPTPIQPSVLRTAGRTLGSTARWLLPRVAAASAGALAESFAPGTGIGLVVGQVAGRVAEDGAELAALSLTREGGGRPPRAEEARNLVSEDMNPIAIHVAALADQLAGLRRAVDAWSDVDRGQVMALGRVAERSLRRLHELVADHGLDTPDLDEVLRDVDEGLGEAIRALSSTQVRYGESFPRVPLERAAHAADYLRHNLAAKPMTPFGGR